MSPSWPRPRTPDPWRWQCHKCRTWYILSCTRRCLHCSHVFCQKHHPAALTPSSPCRSIPGLRCQSRNREKRSRKSRSSGPCNSEFDYDGWAAYGSWRRMTLIKRQRPHRKDPAAQNHREAQHDLCHDLDSEVYLTWKPKSKPSTPSTSHTQPKSLMTWRPRPEKDRALVLKQKEGLYARGEHDCFLHCDSPNECGHAIYAAEKAEAEEAGEAEARRRRRRREDDELYPVWDGGDEFTIFEDEDTVAVTPLIIAEGNSTEGGGG